MTLFVIIALLVCLLCAAYFLGVFSTVSNGKISAPRVSSFEKFLWSFVIIILTALLYFMVGDHSAIENKDISDEIATKLHNAQKDPSNIKQWNELGRAYILEQNYVHAYMAYTEAEKLDTYSGDFSEQSGDIKERVNWLTGLAEARILAQKGGVDSTSNTFVKRALALNPENPKVLWYGGLAAAQENDLVNAKLLWEKLLALKPPEALQNVVKLRLNAIEQYSVQAAFTSWELKFTVELEAALLNQETANSRIFASIRQTDGQPPLAAHAYNVEELKQTMVLNSQDAIPGMGGVKEVNWDEPVHLSLIWSPQGQAIAEDNVKFSTQLGRDNLDIISNYLISSRKPNN